jgi:hypothetical protein
MISANRVGEATICSHAIIPIVFSIYLQNNSNDSITISKQDWHLYLIQEAKDITNNWRPVEYWEYSWCGSSFVTQKLMPMEIIKTESIAYKGKIKTDVRFKLLANSKKYYSNILKGEVNAEQFALTDSIKKKSRYYYFSEVGGKKTAEKIIFLEPEGLKDYLEKNKKRIKWLEKKAQQRNKKETAQ